MSQGLYWLLTIPQHAYLPYLPPACRFIRGQLETGANTGYLHWQVLVSFKRKVRLAGVKAGICLLTILVHNIYHDNERTLRVISVSFTYFMK